MSLLGARVGVFVFFPRRASITIRTTTSKTTPPISRGIPNPRGSNSVSGVKLKEPASAYLAEPIRAQLDELLRAKLEEPAALDTGSKALLAVLSKARDDSSFLVKLAENPDKALKGFDLTSEEKAALSSGDIRWIESKLGTLDEPLRTWLTVRLTQEKW